MERIDDKLFYYRSGRVHLHWPEAAADPEGITGCWLRHPERPLQLC